VTPVLFGILSQSPGDFARLYREHKLEGGHVIKLGPRNDAAAKEALSAWPGQAAHIPCCMVEVDVKLGGLQIGGGVNDKNAKDWLDAGASKVRNKRNARQTDP
jgi:phosphoribosylformimino-5-aminoimidazole carboxamide ribotide isomerase